jgi:hypothetical protein
MGGYATRIEDENRVGQLDMILKLPGHSMVWAEGKMVKHQAFSPTSRQFLEGQKILDAGMRVVLIGWKNSDMAISNWVEVALWDECFIGPNHLDTFVEYMNANR